MTRSIWKGPFIDPYFLKLAMGYALKVPASTKDQNDQQLRTSAFRKVWSRRSCILPQFVGSSVQVYNGKKWISLKITADMVGHKFGEFASTRTIGAGRDKRAILKAKTKLKAKTR